MRPGIKLIKLIMAKTKKTPAKSVAKKVYYRVYLITNAMYPGWGYNLNFLELNQMAIWWLNSMYDGMGAIEEKEFNEKNNVLTNNIQEDSLIAEIKYLGGFDGGLEVEKSESPFDLSELRPGEEIYRPWN